MSMERWNPFRDIDNMRQAMDRWMDDRVSGNMSQTNALSVAMDLHETENGYELEASMPGIKPEDIEIQVDRDKVTLRGKSSSNEDKTERNYIYRERRSGTFYRTVRLPAPVDSEKVEATLEHGILRVQLPKLAQAGQRRIQVRSGSTTPGTTQANKQDEIAATSSNEGGKPNLAQSEGKGSMSNWPQPQPGQPNQPGQQAQPNQPGQPGSEMSNTNAGTTGYGGEKQGLDANRADRSNEGAEYREGGQQARGNEATSSSTSGISDVRAHQATGLGDTRSGGSPEGGETNQYSDQAQKPM